MTASATTTEIQDTSKMARLYENVDQAQLQRDADESLLHYGILDSIHV